MYKDNDVYQKDLEETISSVKGFESLFGRSILITGASGLISSFLIDVLFYANEVMSADIRVYALIRDREYAEHRFCSVLKHPNFHMIIQDVCEPLLMEERVDYIIHAAGDGYPEAFRLRPVETMLPALIGTWQLLEYARNIGKTRFLYISSGEVYGSEIQEKYAEGRVCGTDGRLNRNGFIETDSGYVDSMKSRSCYPSAKRAAETMCVSYLAEYGVDIVVVRPSHVYGPGILEKDNRASAQFFRNVLEGHDVILNSKGSQLRSYTYVADCVSALLTVLIKGVTGEAYNIANHQAQATVAEFARMAAEYGGQKCLFRGADEKEIKERTPISYAILDSEKLRGLGWNGSYLISRGIQHTLQIMDDRDKV